MCDALLDLYHLCNFKNVKNTHGRVKPATLLKETLLYGCFLRFLNCTNGTKSRNASHHIFKDKESTRTRPLAFMVNCEQMWYFLYAL